MARRRKQVGPVVRHIQHVNAVRLMSLPIGEPVPPTAKGALVRYQPAADSTEAEIIAFETELLMAGAKAWRRMPRIARQGTPAAPQTAEDARDAVTLRQRAMRYAERLRGARDVDALKGVLDELLTEAGL